MEPTELATDYEEHAKRLGRVLDFGQELRSQAERQRDFRGLVEVCLQNGPGRNSTNESRNITNPSSLLVEDEQTFENLQSMFVDDRPTDLVVKLFVRKRLLDHQSLVGYRRP